LESEAEKAKIW